MKRIYYTFTILALVLSAFSIARALICFPEDGCTGVGTRPLPGQLLIGQTSSSGNVYVPVYLTAGTNITITTSSGGITIAATAGGGGSGTISTSTRFVSGEIPIVVGTSTLFTTSSLKVTTNTTPFLFEVYGLASSTELRSPSGTIATFTFTNASGTRATLSTSVDSPKGDLTNVSSTRITAATSLDTARTISTNVSSTIVDIGTLTGPLFGDNGRVKASVSATGTVELLSWNAMADTSGDVFWDTTADHLTNDLASYGVWAFNSATGAAPTTKMCLSDVFKVSLDYASTTAPQYVLEWTATSTTGVVVWDVDIRVVTSTASLDQSTFNEARTASSSNPTAVNLRTTTIVTSTASIYSPNDLVMFSICRDGVDAADTGVGRSFLHKAYFEYVKQ